MDLHGITFKSYHFTLENFPDLSLKLSSCLNFLLMFLISSLVITVISESFRKINREVNNGHWRHICATWENTAGSWNFYIDGARVANGEDFQKGHVIKSNGIVILGQDQDNHGGGFQQVQSFFGQMFGVNM